MQAFVNGKRVDLVADINAMHAELGRPGKVTEDVIRASSELESND